MSGVSKTSGNAYKRQEVVLGWEEEYGNEGRKREMLLCVKLSGSGVEKFAQQEIKPGDVITGQLDFDTNFYNGKVYNNIALYI